VRLCCNGITKIAVPTQSIPQTLSFIPFMHLTTLDLSYNAIDTHSFGTLSALPSLTHLDVTYNMLTLFPPPDVMAEFHSLKYIDASNNGLESDGVLISLCMCPTLNHANLSYNYLQRIPKDVIEDGCFTHLETLNLAYNYVADEGKGERTRANTECHKHMCHARSVSKGEGGSGRTVSAQAWSEREVAVCDRAAFVRMAQAVSEHEELIDQIKRDFRVVHDAVRKRRNFRRC